MNKSDIKLIGILILIISIFMLVIRLNTNNNPKEAHVYYNNDLVLRIDLALNELKKYQVDGYNGKVVLESLNGKVRVVEETSPLHICSYQGWISNPYETIVCLPNKVVIKIVDKENEIDAVVR